MADGLVRVKVKAGGKEETIHVSGEHVEDYLAAHPGAVVMDRDWRPMAAPRVVLPKAVDKDK